MPASDRVTGPAQILRQIHLHPRRRLIRHWVQVLVEFRQQADAVAFHHRSGLGACLMIRKAFYRRQACHPHVRTRFLAITIRVGGANRADCANCGIEQHDVNMIVSFWPPFWAKLPERPSLPQLILSIFSIRKLGAIEFIQVYAIS